ncbi:hypothetical protein BA1DRAFT_03304 [Photorhabdus aegyptia]|uniref:Uncharacterized protein n=1 Tax=Photorhabdus aegyptia TaxID=2805098 RepID=A0A022PI34_9GAMM|nr:hypothetical protein BA1DRAFT_03304 [Photorhabdus aegyptia]
MGKMAYYNRILMIEMNFLMLIGLIEIKYLILY